MKKQASRKLFAGSATAVITPFLNGNIDYNAMKKIIDFQISEGTKAIVVCGTTGEVSTLSVEERKSLILYCVECCGGRIPVIAGTGGNNTEACVSMSEYAREAGADGILSVAPYYNKGTKKGIYEHYKRICDASRLPTIVYNVPSRTGINLTPEDYLALSEIDGICAIKESNSKPDNWLKTVRLCGEGMTLYSGNDSDTLPILSLGGKGVISVASNVVPRRISDMTRAYLEGDNIGALSINIECAGLFETLFNEVNPVPVKYAMWKMGFCKNELRLPLSPCEPATEQKLSGILHELGLI